MKSRSHRAKTIFTFLLATAGMAGGCGSSSGRKDSPQLVAPPATVRQATFAGSTLSGPVNVEVLRDAQPEILAKVKVLALREPPPATGTPLGSGARLISANRGGSTLQPTVAHSQKARLSLDAEAAKTFSQLTDDSQVRSTPLAAVEDRPILAGATTVTSLSFADGDFLELSISRPADAPSATIAITSFQAPADNIPGGQEIAILDPVDLANPRQTLITLPYAKPDSLMKGLAILVDLAPPQNAEQFAAALQSAVRELDESTALARSRPTTAAIQTLASSSYQSSLSALKDPPRRRAALIYLCGETGASLCEDFSLVAEDALLERLAVKIGESQTAETAQQRDLLGWTLDRSALVLLAELSADTKTKVAPELLAVLTRHTGEAGRHDSSIEVVVKNLQSRADLDNRLIAENLIYLEDASPSARVRAYDFLKARGKAPAGFDPLAAPRERRAALEKALEPPPPTAAQQ